MYKKIWKTILAGTLVMSMFSTGMMPVQATETDAESKTTAAAEIGSETTTAKTVADLALVDGTYLIHVMLSGGTGRASIDTNTELTIQNGVATAKITWSSPYFDYMIVDGTKYEMVNAAGENSVFEIPVSSFDTELAVAADTTAMSTPHEIDYTLKFSSVSIRKEQIEMNYNHSLELQYAEQFSVDYYDDGYTMINISETGEYLLVPEGKTAPDTLEEDVVVLKQPIQNIYLVATSAMDFFAALDSLDSIKLSGTDADGWYVEEAKQAMEDGKILYAGKYSAPDYEQIVAQNCSLAIESTMIYHTPEVKEKLAEFGIPVMVERSSYEAHPLGRAEWIKLYGVLTGKEEEANTQFTEQMQKLEALKGQESVGKTVAFFYISTNGYANVRKSGDYVSKMIELAGGSYIFPDLASDDNALSTVNMQMEDFYAGAKDADYIIYNSAIDGEIKDISALLQKSELLADFKAVKEGHVWCTTQNLFQKSTGLADLIVDINTMLTKEDAVAEDCTYLYPLL